MGFPVSEFHSPTRRVWLTLLAAFLVALSVSSAPGQSVSAGVYSAEAVRAALLFNFIRFTEWPTPLVGDSPYVVGIVGGRALEDELIKVADRQRVRDRRIHVTRIRASRDLEGCHLLFFYPGFNPADDPAPSVEELLPLVRGKPILTISESPSFLAQGGMVNLYRSEGGRLRFEIAHEAARAAGLVLSAQLLALARNFVPPVTPAPEKTTP